MIQTLFLILSALGIAAALGTVLAKNLVHAALFLVAFFFLVACQFVLLEAEFLAAMQVLVYIGAVSILLMFGIMLTRNIQGDETTEGRWTRLIPASLVAAAVLAVLTVGILREEGTRGRLAWSQMRTRPPVSAGSPEAPLPPRAPAINDMSRGIGREMMTRYVVPFELAGLLLTAAVVGAVAIAMRDPSQHLSEQTIEATLGGGSAGRPRPPEAPAGPRTPATTTPTASPTR